MAPASRSVTAVDDGVDLEMGGALAVQDDDGDSSSPRDSGPYDEDELDLDATDPFNRVDFGALRLPVPAGGTVVLEPTESGHPQAVHIALPQGRLSVSALAAPRSQKLWPDLSREIIASLREGGARVWSFPGEWGTEIYARTDGASSVFVGVDGPRWMLYGVATGPMENHEALDAELRRMLRATVVVRGRSPYPPRTVLPLVMPAGLAQQQAEASAAAGTPEAAVMAAAAETADRSSTTGVVPAAPAEEETEPVPMAAAPPYAYPAAQPKAAQAPTATSPASPVRVQPPAPRPAPSGQFRSPSVETTVVIRRSDLSVSAAQSSTDASERRAEPRPRRRPTQAPVRRATDHVTAASSEPVTAGPTTRDPNTQSSPPAPAVTSGLDARSVEYVGRRRKPEPDEPSAQPAREYVGRRRKPEQAAHDETSGEYVGRRRKPEPETPPASPAGSGEYVGRRRKPEPEAPEATASPTDEGYVGRRRAPEDGAPALTVHELAARLRGEGQAQHAPSGRTVSVAELLARHFGTAEVAGRGGRHRRPEDNES